MICSVLIPTRNRPKGLLKAINSLTRKVDRREFEILVRMDDDDAPTQGLVGKLSRMKNVRVYSGKRPTEYRWIVRDCYDPIAREAKGEWVWIFNDDCWIYGGDWIKELKAFQGQDLIIHPRYYKLNQSFYTLEGPDAFPIVPNGCWRRYGEDILPNPADTQLIELLRGKNGWKVGFLESITVEHDWRTETSPPIW